MLKRGLQGEKTLDSTLKMYEEIKISIRVMHGC